MLGINGINGSTGRVVVAVVAVLSGAFRVGAAIPPEAVLVVYDSRVEGSLEVAEHYAGSANVPGGLGTVAGTRPGVRAFDLASSGVQITGGSDGTISGAIFRDAIRDPIRAHLLAESLAGEIRVLVLCRGVPHRVRDLDNASAGDGPGPLVNEFNGADADASSVDSQLTLLWQNLGDTEAGGSRDSFADNYIANPYHGLTEPITSFSNANNRSPKSFGFDLLFGLIATGDGRGPSDLTPGDLLLVTRLDGTTVTDATRLIDRGRRVIIDTDTAVFVLDESNSNGATDAGFNDELDNLGFGSTPDPLRLGDDYETARDLLLADGRFPAANVRYDAAGGGDNYLRGPVPAFSGGEIVDGPVMLLAHYSENHAGKPAGADSSLLLVETFGFANLARGAIFNTLESFNGRAFNGLGTSFNQEQAADFIVAGGAFAIGTVFEPLGATVADNEMLVRNFIVGDLTWAEAAWSAVPALSWMHVVLGDPLATIERGAFDVNGDGRTDIEDAYAIARNPADTDGDGDADQDDKDLLIEFLRQGETEDMTRGRRR